MYEDKIKAYDEQLRHLDARIAKLKMHKASIMRKRARALRCVNSPHRSQQLAASMANVKQQHPELLIPTPPQSAGGSL